MTRNGYNKIKAEIDRLENQEMPLVTAKIAEAREEGDLKENAEYHAAKERQGFVEGRIQELNGKLAQCNVIDISRLSGEKVIFGATVTYVDIETDEEKTYQIVGEDEADLEKGKISYNSPIARALIGKTVGDSLIIPIPKGKVEVEITDLEFVDK
ncbi:MAG: transcription elongation factor GreA [SAR324 cluster bacterium]|nr:transcription elongation factor GreA [SAR324 cluster bacterium]